MQLDLFSGGTEATGIAVVEKTKPVKSKKRKSPSKKAAKAKKTIVWPRVVDKVIVNPGEVVISCYPRDKVSAKRVTYLSELMESGVELPAIKVVLSDGVYHLIDGRHRITAAQKLDRDEITAEVIDIPESMWLAWAIKYNSSESLQLSASEYKTSIYNLFMEGKLSRKEIAEFLNLKTRYVNLVTEEVAALRKREKGVLCWQLKQEGLSLRQIQEETGIKKSTVQRYIQDEENRQEELKKKEEERQEKAIQAQERAKVRAEKRARNFKPMNEQSVEMDGDLSGTFDTSAEVAVLPTEKDHEPDSEFQALLEQVKDPSANFPLPEEMNLSEIQPGENDMIVVPADHKVNLITNFERIFKSLDPTHKSVLYTVNKIVKNTPIGEISDDLNCPEDWVRNTAFAMLYFYHYTDVRADDVSVILGMERSRVEFVELLVNNYEGSLPKREQLFSWINDNMPKYRDIRYIPISRREKLYWYCVNKGRPVPWEEDKSSETYDIPPDVADSFEQTVQYLAEFQRKIEGITLNKLQAQTLLEKNNRLTIIVNQIARLLADNATREED